MLYGFCSKFLAEQNFESRLKFDKLTESFWDTVNYKVSVIS